MALSTAMGCFFLNTHNMATVLGYLREKQVLCETHSNMQLPTNTASCAFTWYHKRYPAYFYYNIDYNIAK